VEALCSEALIPPQNTGSGIRPAWDNRRMPPRPGDPSPGFMAEPGRWWRMVNSKQLQATHCAGTPSWTGRWLSPRGDRWFRVWACPDHLEGLTGLREFGRRRA
jgi:hypothetical protein